MAIPVRALVALVVGLVAVSTAGPLILLCAIGPWAIPTWRLLTVAALLLPWAARPLARDLAGLAPRERALLLASGVLYGLHFALFTLAFGYTTKESVVLLLGCQPLVAGAVGALWLGEPLTRGMLGASVVALAGLGLFVAADVRLDPGNLVGDALVVACVVLIVLSYALGRRLRPRMSLLGYLAAMYLVGGAVCLAAALAVGDPLWGYAPASWGFLALAVVLPTLVGHSAFHYAVRDVPTFHVSLTILGEPVLAVVLMALLAPHFAVFATSTLTPAQAAGGALLLVGVGVGLAQGAGPAPVEPTPAPEPARVPVGE